MFEIKTSIILFSLLICLSACQDAQSIDTTSIFETSIDSSLFQIVSFNDIQFLVPDEMSPTECEGKQCEYTVLHKEEHLVFAQVPCDQVFEKRSGLHSFSELFLDGKEEANDKYELISIDSVMFQEKMAYILCYKDRPKGFPSITNNECFIFECNDQFNVLHTWSINDLDSSLISKSKYTFVLK